MSSVGKNVALLDLLFPLALLSWFDANDVTLMMYEFVEIAFFVLLDFDTIATFAFIKEFVDLVGSPFGL